MNIKSLVLTGIGLGVIFAGAAINRYMIKGYEKEVENGLDKAVFEKFGADLKDARTDLVVAKAAANDIFKEEAEAARIAANCNPEYTEALATMKTNKAEIDILKKNLKAAQESNSTQVAVGSGNNAVAVSIKDTTQINQIQSDISKLKAEMDRAEARKNTLWKIEHKKVCDARTPEQLEIIANVKSAERKLDHVIFEKEYYRNNLKDDPTFMEGVQTKAYLAHCNPALQVLTAALITIPPLIAGIICWYRTIQGIKVYYSIKKGV